MVIVIYRIKNKLVGSAPAELEKFVKRRVTHYISSPYLNNCFFDALTYLSLPEERDKDGKVIKRI
jgi:hypothetical protein